MKDFSETQQQLDTTCSARQIENERLWFEALQELLPDVLFRLDLKTNTIYSGGRGCAINELPEVLENFPDCVEDNLHPDDMEDLRCTVAGMKQGAIAPCDVRMDVAAGKARWHRHEYVLRYDAAGIPIEAIGRVIDVHEQKNLEERARVDTLTGCLRKETFEELCVEHLETEPNNPHVVFFIDVDDFKSVNENFGHATGDIVLQKIGERLRGVFVDIGAVGRVGGDEFAAIVSDVDDIEVLSAIAKDVVEAMNVTHEQGGRACHAAGSVGFACYPSDGDTYATLANNADIASYHVKDCGKNGFVRYNPSFLKGDL